MKTDQQNPPSPQSQSRSLLYAITAMALAARLNKSDVAVMRAGMNVLPRIRPDHQKIILNIMNSPSPLKHINEFVAHMPDRILQMRA